MIFFVLIKLNTSFLQYQDAYRIFLW